MCAPTHTHSHSLIHSHWRTHTKGFDSNTAQRHKLLRLTDNTDRTLQEDEEEEEQELLAMERITAGWLLAVPLPLPGALPSFGQIKIVSAWPTCTMQLFLLCTLGAF